MNQVNQDPGIWAPADPAVIPDDTDEAPVWRGLLSWREFQARRDRAADEAADEAFAAFMAGSQPYGEAS